METPVKSRKFMRRRDSSTDSIKRNYVTPKSSNGSFRGYETVISPNTNQQPPTKQPTHLQIYLKTPQSPLSTQPSQTPTPMPSQITKLPHPCNPSSPVPQPNKNVHKQSLLAIQKITRVDTLEKIYQTVKVTGEKERDKAEREKCYRSYRMLGGGGKCLGGCDLGDGVEDNLYPHTERQQFKKAVDTYFPQTQILQNEILILQDQNLRLKKQITQLTQQNNQISLKKSQLQLQILNSASSLKSLQSRQVSTLHSIHNNIQALYMQVNRILGFTFEDTWGRIWEQGHGEVEVGVGGQGGNGGNGGNGGSEMGLEGFVGELLEPICGKIVEKMREYRRRFEEAELSLSKMEIKQNILMRNQYEMKNLKGQLKSMTQKYLTQKTLTKRYKQMYQKLKKQKKHSFQLPKTTSQHRLSFNLNTTTPDSSLNPSLNPKKTPYFGEDDVCFTLSDASDEESSCRKKLLGKGRY